MLSFDKVSIHAGDRKLFSDLSVTLLPGSITYITGKNGSGKTSLLRTLANMRKVKSGKITLYGLELEKFHKPYCIYIGHNNCLDRDMKVIDHLDFWASSYNSTEMIQSAVEYWDLDDYIDQYPYILSAGNAKKLQLCMLTCCHSQLWLLDEAEVNLDANNIKFLHNLLKCKAESGGIIIITTNSSERMQNAQQINLEDYL